MRRKNLNYFQIQLTLQSLFLGNDEMKITVFALIAKITAFAFILSVESSQYVENCKRVIFLSSRDSKI